RAIAIDQGLRVAHADEEIGVGEQRARQARNQAVLRNDNNAVVVLAIPGVGEHASRVRQGVEIAPGVGGGEEMRQLAGRQVLGPRYVGEQLDRPVLDALYEAVARFDIAAEGVDEGGYAIEVGVAIVLSENACVVDIVERGEEGDVIVGKAELPRVL